MSNEYRFKCEFISILGVKEALFGLGLSHGVTSDSNSGICTDDIAIDTLTLWERLDTAAKKLYPLDGGHNKFLKFIQVYLDITAPRYWWQDFDTYGVGVSKQSESTMHTLGKRELTQEDFVMDIPGKTLDDINLEIRYYQSAKLTEYKDVALEKLKALIPEGFLQRRIVNASAMALKNICDQRKKHGLKAFRIMCEIIEKEVLSVWKSKAEKEC